MDVQRNNPRERVFSILNDDDSPSFVIRQKQSSPCAAPTKLPSISSFSPRLERPQFLRQEHYQRNSSVSSSGSSSGTPPLSRYDSHSSKSSSGSMDSTPSPITPAYNYNDTLSGPYDTLLRADLGQAYLPPASSITPFLEQQLMIAPTTGQLSAFEPKSVPQMPLYPSMPIAPTDFTQLSTPSLSNHESVSSVSSSATQSKTSPAASNNAPTGKKNKYPCPYAQSHKCQATFTTSGHAARHGKKHTGEKGVHCPICNKAFTRKDNMKQHERTHKNHASKNSDDATSRSKAAITKDAQKAKSHKKSESQASNQTNQSHLRSPVSEVASLAPNTIDTPANRSETPFYQDPLPQMMISEPNMPSEVIPANSLYPPLGDDTLMSSNPIMAQVDKIDASIQMPPTLIRGFSDLDTLAQAAAADFDPYYQPQF